VELLSKLMEVKTKKSTVKKIVALLQMRSLKFHRVQLHCYADGSDDPFADATDDENEIVIDVEEEDANLETTEDQETSDNFVSFIQ